MFSLERVPSARGESSLSASLRPLARRAALPEPPHVALANTSLEPKAIAAFTRRYGPIVEPISSFAGDGPETCSVTQLFPSRQKTCSALEQTRRFKKPFPSRLTISPRNRIAFVWLGVANARRSQS